MPTCAHPSISCCHTCGKEEEVGISMDIGCKGIAGAAFLCKNPIKLIYAPLRLLFRYAIPPPPHTEIVARIEEEQKLVDANKKVIEIFERKIKEKIAEVWG